MFRWSFINRTTEYGKAFANLRIFTWAFLTLCLIFSLHVLFPFIYFNLVFVVVLDGVATAFPAGNGSVGMYVAIILFNGLKITILLDFHCTSNIHSSFNVLFLRISF